MIGTIVALVADARGVTWKALGTWWRKDLPPPAVALGYRLLIASIVAVLAGFLSAYQLTERHLSASDLTYSLRAANRLLAGLDIYRDPSVGPGHPYPAEAQYPAPIFAAFFVTPIAQLPTYLAGMLFCAASAWLLAFGLTRDCVWRLTALLSPPFYVALGVAQWSPIVTATALVPWALPIALAKPTLGAAIFLCFGTRRGVLLSLPIVLASFILWPTWPLGWVESLRSQSAGQYVPPLTVMPLAILLGLTLRRWQLREARLLLLLAAIPQHFFIYDQLYLWLIPRTWRQSLALTGCGWAGYLYISTLSASRWYISWLDWHPGLYSQVKFIVVATFYLPALGLVLWQGRHHHSLVNRRNVCVRSGK